MREKGSTIHIVDDDASVRNALVRLLGSIGYRAAAFDSAKTYLAERPDPPACLILDIRMPEMSGLDLQQELCHVSPCESIIFLTGFGTIPMSVKAMQAGAVDFIEKPFDEQTLLDSVNRAISRHAESKIEARRRTELDQRLKTLTNREKEVFALVVTGMLNKQIASELEISEKTVKIHRARVFAKMLATSLPELVRMADHLSHSLEPK